MTILELPPAEAGEQIQYGEDPNQFGELRLPDGNGPHPVVIFIHGGFWRAKHTLTHASHLCAAITQAGCAVWSLEYRRVGQPGGGYPGTLDDIQAGAKRLTQIPHLDLNRAVAAGHSAGGQLALWLAAQQIISLKAVAGLAAVCDLRRGHSLSLGDGAVEAFLGGSPQQCNDRYAAASPMDLLPFRVPQVMLHGTEDDVVPFAMSEDFVAASCSAHLVVLPGAGHLELIDPRAECFPVVLKTILGLL